MRFRKLRIAWSVLCGIACVLLIALLFRSYRLEDFVFVKSQPYKWRAQFSSSEGRLEVLAHDGNTEPSGLSWQSNPVAMRPEYGGLPDPALTDPDAEDMFYFSELSIPAGFVVHAPHWSFALMAFACAVVPWLSNLNRFSLRTLFIAMTMVAVVVGLVVYFVSD